MSNKFILTADKLKFIKAHSNKYSVSSLSKKLGCSYETVKSLCFDHNVKFKPLPENRQALVEPSRKEINYLEKKYNEVLIKKFI